MATKNTYWLKVYTGLLDNPKFMRLSNETKWHYIALYLLAKKSEAGGWLIFDDDILSIDDIAFQLHDSADSLESSINLLVDQKFLYFTDDDILAIVNYEEQQQNDKDSEYAQRTRELTNKRVAKHRAKVKKENKLSTDNNIKEEENNRIESEKKRIEENRKEKNRIEGNALRNATVTLQDDISISEPETIENDLPW
jgi:dGTP triphosphohydrolase